MNRIITISLLLISFSLLNAQSFEDSFNRFNKVSKQLSDGIKSDNLMDYADNVDNIISETTTLIKNFQYLNTIKDDYRFASGYYAILCHLKLADAYSAGLDNEKGLSILNRVSSYVEGTNTIPLPINFKVYGQNYTINSDNLTAFKNEYYRLKKEFCFNTKRYQELKQTVIAQTSLNNNFLAISEGMAMLIYLDNNKLLTLSNDEKVYVYSNYLYALNKLNNQELTVFRKNIRYVLWSDIAIELNKTVQSIPVSNANTTLIARALLVVSSTNKHSEALIDLYQYTLNNYFATTNYNGTVNALNVVCEPYDYYLSAVTMAKNAVADLKPNDSYLNTAMNILATKEIEKAKKLANQALIKMGDDAKSKNQCERLQASANYMKEWGLMTEFEKYNAMVGPCEVAVAAEKERKAREFKRANSKTNFYFGLYPLGLITKPEKMDFGLAFNFVTEGKSAIELSFLKIQQKRDNYFDIWMMEKKYKAEDLSLWDGYYAHAQFKFFSKNNNRIYNGVLLGYSDKDFVPMTVKTINIQTNAETNETFDPTLRQVIFMLNEGYMGLYKGFGFDVFGGIGATYNRFDRGNTTYNSTTHNIDDNNVLQYRKKQYFSYIMRLGITIGLNVGNGNK